MFTIQTKLPTKNNKFYNTRSNGGYSYCIKGYPTVAGLDVLDNCVGWACGRFNEIYSELTGYQGMKYYQFTCNAKKFVDKAKTLGLEISQTPTPGGIMVWDSVKYAGHVAIVERVDNESQVLTSESGYNSFAFANCTRKKGSNGNWGMSNAYKYIGCIINPAVKDDPIPTPTPVKWTTGNYKLLYAKCIRTSHKITDTNIVKVKQCLGGTKKVLTSTNPNDNAKIKAGTIITITSIYNEKLKDGNRIYGKYGNCWVVLQNKDGKEQAIMV